MSLKRLYLIDAFAMIFRGYFPYKNRPITTSKGENTSAVLGFINIFDRLLKEIGDEVSHIGVIFDPPGGCFRKKEYPNYKATRSEAPEGIIFALPYIDQILRGYGIMRYDLEGYEADDVIGALAWQLTAEDPELEVWMVSPDKDYCQLVRDRVHLLSLDYKSKQYEDLTAQLIEEKYNLSSHLQFRDYLALIGDTSDNIPGVKGIGPKSASALLRKYGDIDNIYLHLEELKPKEKENLQTYQEDLILSRKLVTIATDIPLSLSFKDFQRQAYNFSLIEEVFTKLEMFRSLTRINELKKKYSKEKIEPSLFEPHLTEDKESGNPQEKVDSNISIEECSTQDQINELLNCVESSGAFAFHIIKEDATKNKGRLRPLALAITTDRGTRHFFIPLSPIESVLQKELEQLTPLFNGKALMIAHDLKRELRILSQYGIQTTSPYWDTALAHYLLQPEMSHQLLRLSETLLGISLPTVESVQEKKSLHLLSSKELALYGCEQSNAIYKLHALLDKKYTPHTSEYDLLYNLELPLLRVLLEMELEGVRLEPQLLQESITNLKKRLAQLEEEIQTSAGRPFNVSSPKEVGITLFEHLSLLEKPKKTKTGQYSTKEEDLQKISHLHPIIPLILTYRGLKKLLNTYLEPLPSAIDPVDKRIHTTFNQMVTATGRLSSTDPNLQNIPIREEMGREVRRAFTSHSPEKGDLFISADYSQIELRLMAHFSQDPNLLESYRQGKDIHAVTASKIYKIPVEEVSPELRRRAKTANFGIIYGISAFGLSNRLNISQREAKDLITGYFQAFPMVAQYMEQSIINAREKGCAETLLGRKRYLPSIASQSPPERASAERNAINTPIQGTGADIIKLAMLKIDQRIKASSLRAKMILQVHDELCFSCPADEQETLISILQEEMPTALPEISIPLEIEIGVGQSWLEAH